MAALRILIAGLVLLGAHVPAPAADSVPGVIVAAAERVTFPLIVEALGTAGANEAVEVRPKITETVAAIRFVEGQLVDAGDVLVELEDTAILAAVASAKASLVDSESKYRRALDLFRSALIPASELESLAATRDADRAASTAAEARLAETVIRAPFAGRLGLRRVSIGTLVSPDTVITTLDDTATIKLDFDVPETALSRVAEGLPIGAQSAAWPGERFEGRIASIDTRVDPVSRTVAVRALVPNPDYRLRPGMFLTVRVLHEDVTALIVPEQAVVPEQSRQFVFVVSGDGVVEKRQIELGRRRPGQVEVVSGVEAGELVVVEGTQKAQPGKRVEVVKRVEVGP